MNLTNGQTICSTCNKKNLKTSKGTKMSEQILLNIGALHTGNENGFKTDSLDPYPRSGFNVVARELHTARRLRPLHCLTGFLALSRSTAHSSDPDEGRVEAKWSLNPGPRSASDADPRSCVESPFVCGYCKLEYFESTPEGMLQLF